MAPPSLGSKEIANLVFNPVEPPESFDGPFEMDRSVQILHGRKEKIYKVTFSSDIEKVFNAVVIAKPKLIENPDVKVGILALYFRAETIHPSLFFDKYLTVEGTHKIKLEKWALAHTKKEKKSFVLVN